MVKKFDINSGEFVDVGLPDGGQTPLNTIHSGAGAPDNDIGADGDFYIDTESMNFYGPKEIEWGACVCLLGGDGLPGADGKDGAPGRDGRDGVDGIDGAHGKDGLNGKDGAPGRDGISPPSIELQSTATHVQFRHGSGEWQDLFEIPKNKTIRGSGGGKSMANIQAAINAAVAGLPTLPIDLTTDVTDILPIANGGTGANTADGAIASIVGDASDIFINSDLSLMKIPAIDTDGGVTGGRIGLDGMLGALVTGISNYNIIYAFNSGLLGIAPSATTGRALISNGTGVAANFGALNIATAGNVTGTLQAAQFPALTGNVTTTAGSLATTIANDAVTNARLDNMATQTIKGRITAGTGDPEDLTVAQVNTMLAGYDIPAYTMAQGA